jgi:hypothetical protein
VVWSKERFLLAQHPPGVWAVDVQPSWPQMQFPPDMHWHMKARWIVAR